MKIPMVMTPGPTTIHRSVRKALGRKRTNPDLDPDFFEFYKTLTEDFQQLFHSDFPVLVLNGEGLLGLEATCASLIQPGDRVLCIDNGIYGRGFGEFVRLYGGEPVFFRGDERRGIVLEELSSFLKEDHRFNLATVVHCETPSGLLNPVDKIGPLLKKYGILSVVDSVSATGGVEMRQKDWSLDVVLLGSQKCLSAPPGLSILSISPEAFESMEQRRKPIASFYCNLLVWKDWYEKKSFPYTQPINDLYGLAEALRRVNRDAGILDRHKEIGEALRGSLEDSGLILYPLDSPANTVTTFLVPEETTFTAVFEGMLKREGILLGGGFDFLEGKVLRIGHMGENARKSPIYKTLKALDRVLRGEGVPLKRSLHQDFLTRLKGSKMKS